MNAKTIKAVALALAGEKVKLCKLGNGIYCTPGQKYHVIRRYDKSRGWTLEPLEGHSVRCKTVRKARKIIALREGML